MSHFAFTLTRVYHLSNKSHGTRRFNFAGMRAWAGHALRFPLRLVSSLAPFGCVSLDDFCWFYLIFEWIQFILSGFSDLHKKAAAGRIGLSVGPQPPYLRHVFAHLGRSFGYQFAYSVSWPRHESYHVWPHRGGRRADSEALSAGKTWQI